MTRIYNPPKKISSPSFFKLLVYYYPISPFSRVITISRRNFIVLGASSSSVNLPLLLSPLGSIFVTGVGYYLLFVVGMFNSHAPDLLGKLFLLGPWVFVVLGIYNFLRDIYTIWVVWRAYRAGMFKGALPIKITL